MKLNLFTNFVIIISIRTIYSQICVNFKILGKNGNEMAKEEYTKLKGESWNALALTQARPNSPKPKAPRDHVQVSPISPRRDNFCDIGPLFVQLAHASPITPRREVTLPKPN